MKFSNELQEICEIEGAETPNDNKNYIERILNFDENENPFLVCSGRTEIVLINVRTLKTQALIV